MTKDERRAEMFAAKWYADNHDGNAPTDLALRDAFARTVRPPGPELYPAIRQAIAAMTPHDRAVVVDHAGGMYTFASGADGRRFTLDTAREFAAHRNAGLHVPTYRVYVLQPDTGPAPVCASCHLALERTGDGWGNGDGWRIAGLTAPRDRGDRCNFSADGTHAPAS